MIYAPRPTKRHATAAATAAVFAGMALLTAGPAGAEPPGDLTSNPPPTPPAVTMTTPEVVEGTGGTNELVFLLQLDKPASGGESLRFFTQDAQGSALPVEDHEPVLTHPVFAAGQTELAVPVPVVTDDVPEANEHILVTIDQPNGLTIADGTGTGVILDDDIPTISVDDVTLAEGTGGPTGFHFTVSLSEPSTVDVYVTATPTAGSAQAGTDWQASPQLVQFSPGETTHDVVVSVVGDAEPEDDETFTIELSDPAYGVIADGSGLGTILDDDSAGDRRGRPDAPGRDPASPPRPASDDLAAAPTTTTTAGRTAALDATLAASEQPAPSALPLATAVGFVALAAVSLAGAWRLRHR